MKAFNTAVQVLRTFSFISVDDMLAKAHALDIKINDRTLRASIRDPDKRPNYGVIEAISQLYSVSKGFLLDGEPQLQELYGVARLAGQSPVGYFIQPVSQSLLNSGAVVETESGDSLKNLLIAGHVAYPAFPVQIKGVIVGFTHTQEDAEQLEADLLRTAKTCLSGLRERARLYLLHLD